VFSFSEAHLKFRAGSMLQAVRRVRRSLPHEATHSGIHHAKVSTTPLQPKFQALIPGALQILDREWVSIEKTHEGSKTLVK